MRPVTTRTDVRSELSLIQSRRAGDPPAPTPPLTSNTAAALTLTSCCRPRPGGRTTLCGASELSQRQLLQAEPADGVLDTPSASTPTPRSSDPTTVPRGGTHKTEEMVNERCSPVLCRGHFEHSRIPVLDIGPYLAGDAGAAAALARAIACTCEDTGFLVVANHGVPSHLVEDTFAVAAQFFAWPELDKLALKIGKYNIGYLPFGGQVVRHSPVNKNTKPNFSESFYISRDRAPDH